MSTSLSTRQGLLTRTTGRLTTVLADVANEVRIQLPADEELRKTYVQDKKLRLMKLKKRIHAASDNVDNALRAYTEAADALDSNTPQLPAVLVDIAMEQILMTVGASVRKETAPVQLAPIPIPKFSGKIWEWESFWNAFDFSVHSRNLGDIHKMNYLMEALQGEA
ncbi:hypothetical protein RB195_024646 [Necator americanus]|uniref:BAR domain-containing protein n=1 Tax=Necator americanus TaxID=51031 RepID=A0ABR1EP07_NECAM